jgi:hypothetical protein
VLVIVIQTFHDAEQDVLRDVGERFECATARASQLADCGLVAPAAEQPKQTRAPRRKARKEV